MAPEKDTVEEIESENFWYDDDDDDDEMDSDDFEDDWWKFVFFKTVHCFLKLTLLGKSTNLLVFWIWLKIAGRSEASRQKI